MVLLIVLLLVHDSPSAFAAEDGEAAEASARAEEQMFESLQPPMPAHMLAGWRSGVAAYERFQHEFHRSTGGVLTPSAKAALLEAAEHLKPLAGYTLGAQREFILLGRLQDVHVPLARETAYCSEAAKWSLSRALSPLASNSYAVNESSETTLWNAGVSGAIGYYRRAGDFARAEAALKLARQHPSAATHYERLDQTPLIYYPGLPAHPWWESRRFSIVRSLEAAYAHPLTRARMMAELDQLILSDALQAILSPAAPLGTANATRAPGARACTEGGGGGGGGVEVDRSGDDNDDGDADVGGGSGDPKSARGGAGNGGESSWSESPLFDGRVWSEPGCAALPTLCRLLQGDGVAAEPSLCTAPATASDVNLCGTSIVASVLRLAPGAAVLPHCGITNRRLTMQFALRGSEGVEVIVGGEARGYGGDGRAIVFDDSFEHSVRHGGSRVRYVLYAVLRHPSVPRQAYG
jgi:aspartate beta-hydroxylase